MNPEEVAETIAYELNKAPWAASADGHDITFTNEDGETFVLTVSEQDD